MEDTNPVLKERIINRKQAKVSLGTELVNVLVAFYCSVSGFTNSIVGTLDNEVIGSGEGGPL